MDWPQINLRLGCFGYLKLMIYYSYNSPLEKMFSSLKGVFQVIKVYK